MNLMTFGALCLCAKRERSLSFSLCVCEYVRYLDFQCKTCIHIAITLESISFAFRFYVCSFSLSIFFYQCVSLSSFACEMFSPQITQNIQAKVVLWTFIFIGLHFNCTSFYFLVQMNKKKRSMHNKINTRRYREKRVMQSRFCFSLGIVFVCERLPLSLSVFICGALRPIFHFLVVPLFNFVCCVPMHDFKSYGCNCLFSTLKPISRHMRCECALPKSVQHANDVWSHMDCAFSFQFFLSLSRFFARYCLNRWIFCAQNTIKCAKYCADSFVHVFFSFSHLFAISKPVHFGIAILLSCFFLFHKNFSYL